MASVARAIEQAGHRVDESLWWDSFRELLEDLEDLSAAEDSGNGEDEPGEYAERKRKQLATKLDNRQHWLLEQLLAFKPPNSASNDALKGPKLNLGPHSLEIKSDLKSTALQLSKQLNLDEIQSYIVVTRYMDEESSSIASQQLQNIALYYFLERQCLLKCIRLLLTTQFLPTMVEQLAQKGLEQRLHSNLKQALAPGQPQQLDSEFADIWADETAQEQSLLMDIIFLVYSLSICVCKGQSWRDMFLNFRELVFEARTYEKLALTQEAKKLILHVRCQALLLLIEGLNFQSLLFFVHGEISFRDGNHGFSTEELQELDTLVSRIDPSISPEYAPLLLAWATFICLISGLPDQAMILDIEHAAYAQQACKYGAYRILAELLRSEQLKDSDVSSGYKGTVKTMISACQAAYDFDQEDSGFQGLIVELLDKAYKGEKELCAKFWDRTIVVDGPLRGFLFTLRDIFPQQLRSLVCLLSSLSAGSWSAECVYNFLSNGVPVTCMIYLNQDEDSYSSILHISTAVQIPRCSGLYIPAGAAGHILKRYEDGLALVRWECEHSAMIILLVRLAQWPGNEIEDIAAIVTLLNELLLSNKDLSLQLLDIDISPAVTTARADGRMDKNLRINIVSSVCSVIKMVDEPRVIADCISLLQKFVDSCPETVMSGLEETGLFSGTGSSIRDQQLQLRLTKLEQSFGKSFHVISSVLNVAISLLEKGVRRESLSVFVQYVLRTLLPNHTNWKFTERHERWLLCTKIYQLIAVVLGRPLWVEDGLRSSVFEAMLNDTIIQGVLFHTVTINAQQLEDLYLNRNFRLHEIDALLEVIGAALQLIDVILAQLTNEKAPLDSCSNTFCQGLFHNTAGSTSLISVITSYLGYHSDTRLQAVSARILEKLCEIGQKAKPQAVHVASYISSIESKKHIRTLLAKFVSEKYAAENPSLFYSVLRFLTNATSWQLGMVELILSPWDPEEQAASKAEVLDALWALLNSPPVFSESGLEVLHRLLMLLVSMWQGGTENNSVIQELRNRNSFWENFSAKVTQLIQHMNSDDQLQQQTLESSLAYRCVAAIFQIVAFDLFISAASKPGKEVESNVLIGQITSERIRDVLRPCIVYQQIDDSLLRFKAEARTFVVGLIVKVISGDSRGMEPSFVLHLRQWSSQIISHPCFKELLSQYHTRGYRHPGGLEFLILNDIYHNLQGELDGRQIANRHVQEICSFLADLELETALLPPIKPSSSSDDAFKWGPYDVRTLRAALGLNFWIEGGETLPAKTAEKILYSFERVNRALSLCKSQLLAVDAFVDLLKIGAGEKQASKRVLLPSKATSSLVEDICNELERALPLGKSKEYFPGFLASQTKLLASLLWQLVIADAPKDNKSPASTARVIRTCFSCMKHVLENHQAEETIVRNLFECLLMALQLLSPGAPELDISDLSLSFLPMLCAMVESKHFRSPSLATINILITSVFTSSSTWIPVLQAHLPTKSLVSTMALGSSDDEKTSGVIISFCLYMSRFRAGAEMLFTSGFLQYVSLANPGSEGYEEGPFSMSRAKSPRQLLWASGVAIVTALLRALGENEAYRSSVLDSTVTFFRAERSKLVSALSAPSSKHQRAQTSSALLQEAHNVAALLCELVRQPRSSSAVYFIREELLEFRERALNLLAFIAREGVARSSAAGEGVLCPPVHKQEIAAHGKASIVGSTSAWFLVSARGASGISSKLSAPSSALSGTKYSDSIAIRVYKLVNLLLRFLILQVGHTFQDIDEGRCNGVVGFPELPAPEVLHALQDQVVLVTSEIASGKPGVALAQEASEACCMLLSILEKSFYLEACVFRICGVTPNSMRIDDLARQLKSLARAVEEHSSLASSFSSVREIAAVIYPAALG